MPATAHISPTTSVPAERVVGGTKTFGKGDAAVVTVIVLGVLCAGGCRSTAPSSAPDASEVQSAGPYALAAKSDAAAVEALVSMEVTAVGTIRHNSKAGPLLHDVGVNGLCADVIIVEFPETPDRHAREVMWSEANDGQKVRVRGTLLSYDDNRPDDNDDMPAQRIWCEHLGCIRVQDPVRDLTFLTGGGDREGMRVESLVDSEVVLEGTLQHVKGNLLIRDARVSGVPAGSMTIAFENSVEGFAAAQAWGTKHNGKAVRIRGTLVSYFYFTPPDHEVQSLGEGYQGAVSVRDLDQDVELLGAAKPYIDNDAVRALVGTEVTVVGTVCNSKAGVLIDGAMVNGLNACGVILQFPESADTHANEEARRADNHGRRVRVRGTLTSYADNRPHGADEGKLDLEQRLGTPYIVLVSIADIAADIEFLPAEDGK